MDRYTVTFLMSEHPPEFVWSGNPNWRQLEKPTFHMTYGSYEACCFYDAGGQATNEHIRREDNNYTLEIAFVRRESDGKLVEHIAYNNPPQVYWPEGTFCEEHRYIETTKAYYPPDWDLPMKGEIVP